MIVKLPMSQSQIQRAGWTIALLGAIGAAVALVTRMLNYGDYTWRASSVESLFTTTIADTLFPTPGYREWWQTLGHGSLELLGIGIVVVIIGNPINRFCRGLFAWIAHGS